MFVYTVCFQRFLIRMVPSSPWGHWGCHRHGQDRTGGTCGEKSQGPQGEDGLCRTKNEDQSHVWPESLKKNHFFHHFCLKIRHFLFFAIFLTSWTWWLNCSADFLYWKRTESSKLRWFIHWWPSVCSQCHPQHVKVNSANFALNKSSCQF